MKLTGYLLTHVVTGLGLTSAAVVQANLDANQKALDMIRDFATKLCDSVPPQGRLQDVDLSGKAKAELKGVVKRIADLGIEGAAKYRTSEYEGVLQADLAKLLANQSTCKLEVWRDLKDKLIPSSSGSSTTNSASALPSTGPSNSELISIDAALGIGAKSSGGDRFSLKLLKLQRLANGNVKAYFLHTSTDVGLTLGLVKPESSTYFVDDEGREYRVLSSEGIAIVPERGGALIIGADVAKLSNFPHEIGKQYVLTFPPLPRKSAFLHFYAVYYGQSDRGCCFSYRAAIKNIKFQ
ncbi:MAG: hypothetical protein WA210_21460 [Burkholderiaceae bacterium]